MAFESILKLTALARGKQTAWVLEVRELTVTRITLNRRKTSGQLQGVGQAHFVLGLLAILKYSGTHVF